jgi:hypothetical protein
MITEINQQMVKTLIQNVLFIVLFKSLVISLQVV